MEIYGRKVAEQYGMNRITTAFMTLFHVGAVAALFFWSWTGLISALALWWITCGWGVGVGYHRLLTHRGYKTPKWVEYALTVCGTMALEGGPIFWVGTHRIHHQNSDKEGDPHTPRDGKWWAHMGWVLFGRTLHDDSRELRRYVPDLLRDPFQMWISKYHWVPLTAFSILLTAAGYLAGGFYMAASLLTWGVFLRTVIGLHGTFLVNSGTHLWGSRRIETRDDSRNNWWVALVSFGEGWHNNHHAFPVSARHGLAWYEFDVNWLSIQTLRLFGLAKEVHVAKLPSRAEAAAAATAAESGRELVGAEKA